MLKLLFFIVIIGMGYGVWHLFFKNKIHLLSKNQHDLSKFLKDATSPKTKDQKIALENTTEIHLDEQQLFDDVAKLMFERNIIQQNVSCAENIQTEFLNKMPVQARSQIGEFDLGEWCIFWTHHDQSLEYYASRYGVFYTHVDRNGIEHKAEHKI